MTIAHRLWKVLLASALAVAAAYSIFAGKRPGRCHPTLRHELGQRLRLRPPNWLVLVDVFTAGGAWNYR